MKIEKNRLRVAQLQNLVSDNKEKNLFRLEQQLDDICKGNIDLVALGEMFTCPYETKNFPLYAEMDGEETWQKLSQLSRKYGIYLSAGSVPEKDEMGKVYNTAYIFDREGKQIAKHRKVHLFDVDIIGGQRFFESETLTGGDHYTVFDTEFGKMGICICFDFRFPELARTMVLEGAKVILVPAAFNMTTGPAHWDIMFRSRAIDNQCYVVGTSPARDEASSYVAWGHSLVVSPWGEILQEADKGVEVLQTELDLEYVTQIRQQLPLLSSRRTETYKI